MLDGLLDDLIADSPPCRGEIRPDSPVFRPDETCAVTGFSPNSPLLWWRITIRCPDGWSIELDAPSGMSLAQAREYASVHFGGGEISVLKPLAEARQGPKQPRDPKVLAGEIATETGLAAAGLSALLSEDDRKSITTGSDPGRAEGWRCAARSLAATPQPIQALTGTTFPRWVVAWTPARHPVLCWADSAEHAKLLSRWNPAAEKARREAP